MAATSLPITLEEFRTFHEIDRTLYSLLVNELQRDPTESMQTLALWIWLERTGSNNVIVKILSLPNNLINELANEAATCLKCIEDNRFLLLANTSEIPLTGKLIAKEFSLFFLNENRDSATSGIRNIITDVCLKALSDIMEKALNRRCSNQTLMESEMSMVSSLDESYLIGRFSQLELGGGMSPRRMMGHDDPRVDRTMFVTFSKGYPIAEWEIREFITMTFGECIECIFMQEVKKPQEQALYALIVFVTPGIVKCILNDKDKAKFTINKKHMWMRKFVPNS
ncbi:hypothetical protein P3S68_001373 [Capsicum galapagoense]